MNGNTFKANKSEARKHFDGSNRLFNACWHQYIGFLRGAIENPTCQKDVDDWLEQIASEKVNNPQSVFYIYG